MELVKATEPEQLELPGAELLMTPVEGWCPYCPHRLGEHYRERFSCMASAPGLTWACPCSGPDADPPGIPS